MQQCNVLSYDSWFVVFRSLYPVLSSDNRYVVFIDLYILIQQCTVLFSDNRIDVFRPLSIPDSVQIEQLLLAKSTLPDDSAVALLILPNRDS